VIESLKRGERIGEHGRLADLKVVSAIGIGRGKGQGGSSSISSPGQGHEPSREGGREVRRRKNKKGKGGKGVDETKTKR
jgi:hypothetical protein